MVVLTRPVGYRPLGDPFRRRARIQRLGPEKQRELLERWLAPSHDQAAVSELHARMSQGLHPAFRAIRRVRPGEVPPFGAFTEAVSSEFH
jgi:hypothetical protein